MITTHESEDPAARLFRIASSWKAQARGGGSSWATWESVVGALEPDEMLRVLAGVIALPGDIKALLTARPDLELDLHTRSWLGPMESWLANVKKLGADARPFAERITDASLLGLEFVSHALRRGLGVVDPDERRGLQVALDELRAEILADDTLDPRLKDFMLASVREMVRALDLYEIFGSEGVARAAARAVGGLYLNDFLQSVDSSPENSRGRRFWNLMCRAQQLITLTGSYQALDVPNWPEIGP